MLGHLFFLWPFCWQFVQVGGARLRGVPPRSSTPNFRFVEGGRPRDWRTTGGSARFETTPSPRLNMSLSCAIDGATGYSRTLSSSLLVGMPRNVGRPCSSWVELGKPRSSLPTNGCHSGASGIGSPSRVTSWRTASQYTLR